MRRGTIVYQIKPLCQDCLQKYDCLEDFSSTLASISGLAKQWDSTKGKGSMSHDSIYTMKYALARKQYGSIHQAMVIATLINQE
jgi:hypothetical protein